jgi:hypothetical protein
MPLIAQKSWCFGLVAFLPPGSKLLTVIKAFGSPSTRLLALTRGSRYRLPMHKPAQDGS